MEIFTALNDPWLFSGFVPLIAHHARKQGGLFTWRCSRSQRTHPLRNGFGHIMPNWMRKANNRWAGCHNRHPSGSFWGVGGPNA